MSKILKKSMVSGIALCMMLCMVGCVEKEKAEKVTYDLYNMADMRYAERYQTISLTESGVLYDGNDGLMHLITIDEGEDIIMCYDPNCTHEPATSANPDPKCMAALFYEKTQTAYYEGHIYFFVNDGAFRHKLYRMKTDGSGRELLAEKIPFSYKVGYGVVFRNDKMYYTAKIPYTNEQNYNISYMNRLVEFDLIDKTYRFITEETADTILLMHITENYMYMRMSDADDGGRIYYKRTNLNTCEEEIVISADVHKNEYVYIRACSDDRFFYIDRMDCDIGIRSVDGEYKEIIVEGAEGERFSGWERPSGNYMIYQRTIPYEGEAAGYYFLNLATGERVDITAETEKYSIVDYDVTYDAFITRVYDEDAMKFNWGMQSREKILAEAAK